MPRSISELSCFWYGKKNIRTLVGRMKVNANRNVGHIWCSTRFYLRSNDNRYNKSRVSKSQQYNVREWMSLYVYIYTYIYINYGSVCEWVSESLSFDIAIRVYIDKCLYFNVVYIVHVPFLRQGTPAFRCYCYCYCYCCYCYCSGCRIALARLGNKNCQLG